MNNTSASRLLAIPALAAAGLLAGPITSATATADPAACGAVVTADIRLGADLVDCPGSGLVVGAPGITIDLAGHTIDGTGTGTGVDNTGGHDGVRITGGTIREFLFGIDVLESSGARFDRLALRDSGLGMIVARSDHGRLDRVEAVDNRFTGISINFSERVAVRRSVARNNGEHGFADMASFKTTYERNESAANAVSGFALWQSQRITLTRNVALDNGFLGIDAETADGTVDGGGNVARGNGEADCLGVVCG
jgi:hypothetical protein